MIITGLQLTNFRNHKKLNLKFKSGVTGIIGENGSGKSSIVEGILFGLTGELFTGTRKDAVKLGEDDGHVILTFELNKKVGTIERHLGMSKVVLIYDDDTKRKAGDVKELWDKLLQISTDIVKRVIIAEQGHITLLFSGDPSIREKVFQKIFLVPNTDRIRNVIWEKYVKTAPPLVRIDDLPELKDLKELSEKQLAKSRNSYNELKVLAEKDLDNYKSRLVFLNKCREDAHKKSVLQETTAEKELELVTLQEELKDTISRLKEGNLDTFERTRNTLVQQKNLYTQKLKLEEKLQEITLPFDDKTLEEYINERKLLQTSIEEQQQQVVEFKVKLQTIDRVCSNYATFVAEDQEVCETCGQRIEITEKDLEDRRKLRTEYELEYDIASKKFLKDKKREEELGKLIQGWSDVSKEIGILKKQFSQFEKITFDEQDLLDYNTIIDNYKSLVRDRHALELSINDIANSIALLKKELSAICIYDGKSTVEKEREEISTIIVNNTEAQRKAQELKTDIGVKEANLTGINNRIRASEDGLEKNKKINNYVAMLHKLYDGFHTSQFPRQLILSYADIVTDYLQEKLDSFSIPYKVRVADNFKIEMLDDQERVLPDVSGGQKMQVGLSLHIALHDLFSQSFPLMIIDEGTNALDKANRAAYFDIIKNLKEKNKLKQILIIDHDPMLSEVVDQVIELKND